MKKLLFLLLLISQTAAAQVGYGFIDQSSAVTYATWNPADKSTNITLSISNTKAESTSAASDYQVRSTISKNSGKHYWEITFVRVVNSDPNFVIGGISQGSESVNNYTGFTAGACITTNGQYYVNGGSFSPGWGAWTDGDVAGFALDLTGGSESLKIYRNNTLLGSITISAGTYFAGTGTYQTLGYSIANFGATAMAYTAPAGYNQGLYQ